MAELPAIHFDHVSKAYTLYPNAKEMAVDQLGLNHLRFWNRTPNHKTFEALHDVDFSIQAGERVGIIGRNGAGKTTLLKLITGNFRPSAGRIEVNGKVHALMNIAPSISAEFSGFDHIKATLTYSGLKGIPLSKALEDAIDFVELDKYLHQPMVKYSKGMAMRVHFAAATAVHADIFIIDEVMGAGDAYFLAKSAQRMKTLTDNGSTVVLVSHSMQQIMQFCDQALWLERGKLLKQASASEIAIEYEREATRITLEAAQQDKQFHSLASSTFLRAAILPHEPIDTQTDTEETDTLRNGTSVFRWSGTVPSPYICDIESPAGAGSVIPCATGEPIRIRLYVASNTPGSWTVQYGLSIYSLRGERVAHTFSPVDSFFLKPGETRRVDCNIDALLLGAGNYIASLSIFDASQPLTRNNLMKARLDLLSRCLHFKVATSNDPDPPMVHCPGTWSIDRQQVPSRINSWV